MLLQLLDYYPDLFREVIKHLNYLDSRQLHSVNKKISQNVKPLDKFSSEIIDTFKIYRILFTPPKWTLVFPKILPPTNNCYVKTLFEAFIQYPISSLHISPASDYPEIMYINNEPYGSLSLMIVSENIG